MLAFSNDYYGFIFRVTQSVELFCTYKKTKGYSNKLKINNNCIGCGKCVSICPMKNLILRNKKVVSNDRCTMCYRCISLCPQKAITLLGNEVVEQYRIEDYR